MEIEVIKDWANQNQGVLSILLFLASLVIGWMSGFFKWLVGKFSKNADLISAGRDIKAGGDVSAGNKKFIQKGGKNSKNIQGENITLNKHGDDK